MGPTENQQIFINILPDLIARGTTQMLGMRVGSF